MDLLRRIWSAVRSDPRDKFFATAVDGDADVDINRSAVIASTIRSILPPELSTIIAEYAVDVRYGWSNVWNTMPADYLRTYVKLSKYKAVCSAGWMIYRLRIVAAQSITDGPRRWRIQTDFDPVDYGEIAIGLSTAPAGLSIVDDDNDGRHGSTRYDYVVSTVGCPSSAAWINFGSNKATVFCGRRDFFHPTDYSISVSRRSVTVVEFDPASRLMSVGFRDNGGCVRAANVHIPAFDSLKLPTFDGIWRPVVIVSGVVSATVLDWPK